MAWSKKKVVTLVDPIEVPTVEPGMELHEATAILAQRESLLFPQPGDTTPGARQFPSFTIEEVESYMIECGLKYRGRWQRRIMMRLIEHRFCRVKGPRQNSGKTWCIAVLSGFTICKFGMPWIIAMPTMRQGSRILVDRVKGMVDLYRLRHPEMVADISNANYMTWTSPDWEGFALLAVVSLHEGSRAGVQGYTAVGLIIDEGHECDRTIYDAVLPVLDVAAADEQSRVIVSGIGGIPGWSLICILGETPEQGSEDEDRDVFELVHITVEEIGEESPKLKRFYAKKKLSEPPNVYRRNYDCEDFMEGGNTIFPELATGFPNLPMHQGRMTFGIDVGRTKCYTIVVAMREWMDHYEVVDVLRLRGQEFSVQAKQITKWIDQWDYLPFDIRCELNGLSRALYERIREESGFRQITPVTTSDDKPTYRKSKWIWALMEKARRGRLAVKDAALRKELMALQFEQAEDGTFIWPESNDLLSALWVWQAKAIKSFAA